MGRLVDGPRARGLWNSERMTAFWTMVSSLDVRLMAYGSRRSRIEHKRGVGVKLGDSENGRHDDRGKLTDE